MEPAVEREREWTIAKVYFFALLVVLLLISGLTSLALLWQRAQRCAAEPAATGLVGCAPEAFWDATHKICLVTCPGDRGPAFTWVPPSVCGRSETP